MKGILVEEFFSTQQVSLYEPIHKTDKTLTTIVWTKGN